jgi:hypothetical protein
VITHPHQLSVGDRVVLSDGYDFEPPWLQGNPPSSAGSIISFISGQNDTPAAVVRLDQPITVNNVTGDILVLELRFAGATWSSHNIVHIELCDFTPEPKAWKDRRQGLWVESSATCNYVAHPV